MPGRRPQVLSRAPRQAEPVSYLSSSLCCSPARRPPALSPHMIEKITVLSSLLCWSRCPRTWFGSQNGPPVRSGVRLRPHTASSVRVYAGVRAALRGSCVWAEAPVADLVFAPTLACCGGRWTQRRRLGPAPPALHLSSSPSRADSRPVDGQGLLLSRTMLGNHGLPYVSFCLRLASSLQPQTHRGLEGSG